MFPIPDEKLFEALLRWMRGNQAAAFFLYEISQICRLADDIVDKDENRQRNVCWLLSKTMTQLAVNPFFVAHAAVLAPLINCIVIQWHQSDELRAADDDVGHMFGFVFREQPRLLVTAAASIVGGYQHAKEVADELLKLGLSCSDETVEQWASEGK